ncbi:MAG TPA: RNA-binding S4 domain-containing protein [Acidimicrobiales bacterium]|nr:RNA-binding S4 domain-containing protein [Acidimicrobiales bacterium]
MDRWLWSIRLFKSRAEATDACRAGHVRINGRPAKSASTVDIGDRVDVRVHGRDRNVEVARLLNTRVGAPIAVECYIDHSPPPPPREAAYPAARERGAGRPTKRERRELDRWRDR